MSTDDKTDAGGKVVEVEADGAKALKAEEAARKRVAFLERLRATLGVDDAGAPAPVRTAGTATAAPGDVLDPGEPAPELAIGAEELGAAVAAYKLGPYALHHDAWSIRRGRELTEPGGTLEGLATPEAAADFHAAAYEPEPVLERGCIDGVRHEYLSTLMETPEWRELNEAAMLNTDAAEMAARHFGQGYVTYVAAVEEGAKDTGPHAPTRDRLRRNRAARDAAKSALGDVRDYGDAADAFGVGGPGGGVAGAADMARIAAVWKKVKDNDTLKRIIEQAGLFRRVAQGRRTRRSTHGLDNVTGVEMGSDLARIVPSELSALASGDEYRELDAARRLLEGQAIQRSVTATEQVGRGPVVVVVDESGSMNGARVEAAKGLALAVAWVARRQRRWVGLVGFSGGTTGTLCVLPPGKWDEAALIEWVEHFYGGGTCLDVPIKELPFNYWPKMIASGAERGKTDIIMITDAEVNAPKDQIAAFAAWKAEEKVKVKALILDNEPGDLARIADTCHRVKSIDATDEAVASALDI